MSELPKGWESKQLKELFSFVLGGDWGKDPEYPDADFETVYCIRGTEFRNWKKEKGLTSVERKVKSSSVEKRKLQEGDILIEISGGGPDQPVGRTILIDEQALNVHENTPLVCTNFIRLARPQDSVSSRYLNYYLQSFYLSGEVTKYQGGSNNLRNLKFKEYEKIEVPIAPLEEQKRIADKLDSVLAKVEAAQARLDKIPAILKRFRQSVLAAATSGELTKEWREGRAFNVNDEIKKIHVARLASFQADAEKHYEITGKNLRKYDFSDLNDQRPQREIPESWEIVPLGNLITFLTDYHANGSYEVLKKHVELKESEDYACMIRATNFEKKNFDDLMIYVNKDAYEFLSKSKLYGGEILVGKIGNAGSVYHMPNLNKPCSLAMNLFALRFNESLVSSRYVYFFLKSFEGEKNIQKYVRGVTTKSIDKKSLRSVFVNLPSYEEQLVIVERVEKLFATADIIEKQYHNASNRVDKLATSILSKAFKGEIFAHAVELEITEIENSIEALNA